MRFDGAAVLRKMLDHPELFPLEKEADQLARKVMLARLKAATQIDQLRVLCQALGTDHFKLVVDGITDKDAGAVLGKVDKENKEAKTAEGPAQRILLVELATGAIEPRVKAVKEKAASSARPRAPKSAAGKAIKATSTAASRTSKSR